MTSTADRGPDILRHLAQGVLLTDSGLETDLIFHHGFDLPCFAAFVLLDEADGVAALRRYYLDHAEVAASAGAGFVFEAPTWRANPEWGAQVGYDLAALGDVNRRAIALLTGLREELAPTVAPAFVSGCIGPRGDGYSVTTTMTAGAAHDYHAWQIAQFATTEADLVTAMTLTYADEAIGVAQAAAEHGLPSVLSFTVETDGRLPDGSPLGEAIDAVDQATGGAPLYFMINCAHPQHFEHVLATGDAWTERVRGLRANASRLSHAELDEADELDDGDPLELGDDYARVRQALPNLAVLGGCCGTDVRHVRAIAAAFPR